MENQIKEAIDRFFDYRDNKKELSSLIGIEESEVLYFVIQYELFEELCYNAESDYVNYFFKIDIFNCEENKLEHKKETFIKALITFIKCQRKEKTKFHLDYLSKEKVELYLSVLNQIPEAKDYYYEINVWCNDESAIPFLNFAKHITASAFKDLLLEKQIPINSEEYLKVSLEDIDRAINYSKKFPNKFGEVCLFEGYTMFKTNDKNKLKELISLNKESFYCCDLSLYQLYKECPNITKLSITKPLIKMPKNIDYSKINTISIEYNFHKNATLKYVKKVCSNVINVINQCPNLTKISLFSYTEFMATWNVFPILININAPNLKEICINFDENELDLDFDPIIEKFPKLEKL